LAVGSKSQLSPLLHQHEDDTVASLIRVIDFGLTPKQAINDPSLGSFEFGGVNKLSVGVNELTPQFLQAVRVFGQDMAESDP
jgi:hypothetical protein